MAGKSAQGIILTMDPGATPVVVGNVTKFSGPTGSATIIDATTLASTAKEKMTGLPDSGQFTADINFDPADASHIALHTAWAAGTLHNWELDLGAKLMTWSGYVTGFSIEGAVDALVTGTITIEITGEVEIGTDS